MGYKFNPFTGSLDTVDSPNGIFSEIDISGDITLDDGGTYTTTVQVVTPTADRTISFPDATGTVALVAGSNGQLIYNNAGAQSGLSTLTTDGTDITLSGRFISSLNGAADEPPGSFTGTWFTGGTATTTKPQVLIEPSGTTSTAWSTNGTGLGVNAASGFSGNLLDLQVNGTSQFSIGSFGQLSFTGGGAGLIYGYSGTTLFNIGGTAGITLSSGGGGSITFGDNIPFVFGTTNGTKFGTSATQKIGFYNTTPVVQPTAVADATDAASVITQLNALLSRMRDLGLIAT